MRSVRVPGAVTDAAALVLPAGVAVVDQRGRVFRRVLCGRGGGVGAALGVLLGEDLLLPVLVPADRARKNHDNPFLTTVRLSATGVTPIVRAHPLAVDRPALSSVLPALCVGVRQTSAPGARVLGVQSAVLVPGQR
ncbi:MULTISPECIES: hypothetical protein [unclassified Rhodococcus (in: high G+C Gram-positive bacteria)]|uniref:hypothetical protein n=1 Tax=unclassified Rhodococcus (in: high G+C Gram-positive bacteria) TaxID=192944 RepID=UPI001639B76F|nr:MULTISPECIES: hypothetical protein [unclassified Rhodococcus (in: high G+C Gram-positive bacteria)]MBC2644455.1 hypothetical protein [Rhodococcus sp. 3A]